jgi:hypothetical protein
MGLKVAAICDDLGWFLFDREAFGARREMDGFRGIN